MYKCKKCESNEYVKAGFVKGKQRYKCKKCGCHYTVSRRGYPEHIKRKATQIYMEGNGFGGIERILKVSHVSVISLAKKADAKLEKVPKRDEKVEIVELDELCISKKISGSG